MLVNNGYQSFTTSHQPCTNDTGESPNVNALVEAWRLGGVEFETMACPLFPDIDHVDGLALIVLADADCFNDDLEMAKVQSIG